MRSCAACGSPGLVAHLSVRRNGGSLPLIPTTDAYGAALADIVRCPACGHMQLGEFPDESTLLDLYEVAASEDYVKEEAGQRATARAALDRIERWAPRRGRLLDLGSWVGFLLDEARARGWEVVGVEPSSFAASYARERLGLDVRQEGLLTASLPTASFDAVVMGDVIEHLIDPGAALDRIREVLVPGGVLYLALPDAGSPLARRMGARWWSVLPTHVQYFTRQSMRTLLGRHGLEAIWVGTAPKTFSVRYYLWRLGGYSHALSHALVAAARSVGIADHQWTPDFRDRMAVVARRTGSP